MKYFLSCDWGTSSFRLRLVEDLKIIAEERSGTGIAGTYQQWQQASLPREEFFAAIINRQIDVLAERTGISLEEIPVVLSGMASSSIGMVELPYKELPFSLSGSDLTVHRSGRFIIISGACSENDVMRGEETKVVGCAASLPDTALLLMPGTHNKHLVVKGGEVVRFKTYMTGEFFDLLSTHSILAASVNSDGMLDDPACRDCFKLGLQAGWAGNLLHAAFMVRTNQLLKKIPPAYNSFYLSGLLIGAELKEVPANMPVYLVAGASHIPLYTLACQILSIRVEAVVDADEALIRGQWGVISNVAD
ncbi:2-dehydro-3-deoxygalactonokinase [Chitinophaga niabensis]|uniref:2-dehydro-3-deoxygalactonokinase n=1 Tax=Chitinophaga niabensis TaxID=536979 RepID=UPI0031BB7771